MKRREDAFPELDLTWPAETWVKYLEDPIDNAHRVLDAAEREIDLSELLAASDDNVNMMTRVLNQTKYAADTTGFGETTPMGLPSGAERLSRAPRKMQEVDGVAFHSQGGPGSTIEHRLAAIQFELAGTKVPGETDAHLFGYMAATVGGPSISLVGLWVPNAQEPAAVQRLKDDGFQVDTAGSDMT